MSTIALTKLATFDDIRRCTQVLIDGSAEEEFLRVLRLQEKFRLESIAQSQETERIQKELDASLKSLAELETKLYHARQLLEYENKHRRMAEHERDQMEKKIIAVADLLQNERNLRDETKDKLAFLNTLPRKRKSLKPHLGEKYGNEINSTGSFLSDLSITQSDDDFLDANHSAVWRKHRPSLPKNTIPCVGAKRSRKSVENMNLNVPQGVLKNSERVSETRRSALGTKRSIVDIGPGTERIRATTKVTIPQDGSGAIRAESKIESLPVSQQKQKENDELDIASTSPPSKFFSTFNAQTPVRQADKNSPVLKDSSRSANVVASASPMRSTIKRQHNFVSKTVICTDTCVHCQKKMGFGTVAMRCRDCPMRCHSDCRHFLTMACVPSSNTPTLKGQLGNLVDYAPITPPMIPALIIHCVNEIEMRGLKEVGLYRISGSEREVKALKERFLRKKGGPPNLTNIDIHVLCSCIKDFLRSLPEPLVPTQMWKSFNNAVEDCFDDEMRSKNLSKVVESMPQPNRDTLAFLVLHFQRIAVCPEILMPIENLARIFGPTIVGYSSQYPDQAAIFTEVAIQYKVMLELMKLPTSYWTQYVTTETSDKESDQNSATVLRTPSRKQKESLYSLYATPFRNGKRAKFFDTPTTVLPHSSRK